MTVLQIVGKTEKVDKASATYWELDTPSGKHRAWERNNKEGFEIGKWYECEITQQGNFLPQIQQSTHIDPPPTGGVQDMMASVPAVPQEIWEANHRGEDMRSAIHAVASICQAVAQGVVISDLPGGTPDGRSLEVFPLIKAFYDLIQDARNGSVISVVSQSPMPLAPTLVGTPKTDTTVPHGAPLAETLSLSPVSIEVKEASESPLVIQVQELRKEVFGEDMDAFKQWAKDNGFLSQSGRGVAMAKLDQVVEALREQIAESEELPV